MKEGRSIPAVEHGDLLYAVVIGIALTQLTKPISIVKIAMLTFSFLIILDDWLLYRFEIPDICWTTSKEVKAYVLDIFVLIVWYLAVITPPDRFDLFLILVAIFFLLALLWESILLGEPDRGDLVMLSFVLVTLALFFGFQWFHADSRLRMLVQIIDACCAKVPSSVEYAALLFLFWIFVCVRLKGWWRLCHDDTEIY